MHLPVPHSDQSLPAHLALHSIAESTSLKTVHLLPALMDMMGKGVTDELQVASRHGVDG